MFDYCTSVRTSYYIIYDFACSRRVCRRQSRCANKRHVKTRVSFRWCIWTDSGNLRNSYILYYQLIWLLVRIDSLQNCLGNCNHVGRTVYIITVHWSFAGFSGRIKWGGVCYLTNFFKRAFCDKLESMFSGRGMLGCCRGSFHGGRGKYDPEAWAVQGHI